MLALWAGARCVRSGADADHLVATWGEVVVWALTDGVARLEAGAGAGGGAGAGAGGISADDVVAWRALPVPQRSQKGVKPTPEQIRRVEKEAKSLVACHWQASAAECRPHCGDGIGLMGPIPCATHAALFVPLTVGPGPRCAPPRLIATAALG